MPRLQQGLLAAVAALLAACGPAGGPPQGFPPSEVAVITVEARSLPAPIEYTGQTAGSREVEVRARVNGILQSRNFTEGARVAKGQSLYTIDPAPFAAAVARAEADLASAEARAEQARRNAERLKPLAADKAVSQKEIDDARSADAIAAADVKAARARLTEAQLNLAYTKVEAPAAGVTSRSLRSEGTLVPGPDVLLTTITQLDPIWVNFGIPDNDQLRMQADVESGRLVLPADRNFEVTVKLADGSVYAKKGRLAFTDIRVSGQTGTSEARAELANPEGKLRPGQFVRVTLSGATRPNAVLLPQRAVMEGPQGKFVYVVDEKSIAQARPVKVGEWAGGDWIVTDGLKAGERVIVDGVMKIGPGAPVTVAEPGKGDAAKADAAKGVDPAKDGKK